jgi:very-long-chain (3R)-3-hydroxyacyl-CoA dehydratase
MSERALIAYHSLFNQNIPFLQKKHHRHRSLPLKTFFFLSSPGFFQLLAILEILHAAIGIVGGSPVTSLMQWGGRSNVLFAVVKSVPEVQATPAVGAMLLAWALSEVVRYPWYAAVTAGVCPEWLTWLRYTAFIPLYPVGVVGEMHAMYLALPYIGARKLHSVMLPNPFNFAFDYRIFMIVS